MEQQLASPFREIFQDEETANWAFDFMKEVSNELGVTSNEDSRISITYVKGGEYIGYNFCQWVVARFYSQNEQPWFRILLLSEAWRQLGEHIPSEEGEPFAHEVEIRLYRFSLSEFRKHYETIMPLYKKTLEEVHRKFRNHQKSPFKKSHHDELGQAIFNLRDDRQRLLQDGLVTKLDKKPTTRNGLKDLAADTGLFEETLTSWLSALERKGQAILYGPPGTGKTYVAKYLAEYLTNQTEDRIDLVQFHPAYTYEDFMQGIRPVTDEQRQLSYSIQDGRFLEFCKKARKTDAPCVLIIDEINRANLSRVFGELMYALEYRDQEIKLASGETFTIPENVRIIGTMNTADRSIALVDHALRRRFAFLPLKPNYEVLEKNQAGKGFDATLLIRLLERVNGKIADANYELGISFFIKSDDLREELGEIWQMEIEPYLEEYFFNQPDTMNEFRWERIKEQVRG